MPILDDCELQHLANMVTNLGLFKDDCLVEHTSGVDDPYGSESPGTPVTRTVKCMASPISNLVILQTYNEKIGALGKWKIRFPLGHGPVEGDRLTISGQKMIVQLMETPQSYAVMDSCIAAEVN